MVEEPLRITRHASERMLSLSLTFEDLQKIRAEGKVTKEGRTKLRIAGRFKKGVVVLICEEYPDHIALKTVVKGR